MMKETSIIGVALYNATKVHWASCAVSCFLVFELIIILLLTFATSFIQTVVFICVFHRGKRQSVLRLFLQEWRQAG